MSAAIVVRTPNWLGDTVMALPALTALRAADPEARITVVGRWAPLLAGQGIADVVLPYPRTLAARRRLAAVLAALRADVA
ncbi:MAG TPA: lipopolysaccharide heptosyltransferase II, partial [Methylomirabilota bacterium]